MALPLVAAVVQWVTWPLIQPYVWFLFYPTVFFSSEIGGLRAGLVSTVLSAFLVVFVFVPPQMTLASKPASTMYSVLVFGVMGVLFSVTHERLSRANRRAAEALHSAEVANDNLQAAHADVTRLYEQTREMERLKTQFFANVSHELRTPLTLILGSVTRRLSSADTSDETRRDLDVVLRNARLLHRHVNDLLDVSRLESGKVVVRYQRIDLARSVRRVASLFEILARDRAIDYEVDAPDTVMADIDGEKTERIVVNLLGNAFKFTPSGGRVMVSLSATDGHARLAVADTGPGVPADQRTVVFEAFRQLDGDADRRQSGTGLGLAIVKEFTRLQGGRVWIDETPGGGATVVVEVPLAAPEGVPVAEGPDTMPGGSARQVVDELLAGPVAEFDPASTGGPVAPLLLIVEDNPDMSAFLRETFRVGYRVATAGDGEQGLEKALALKPDLILSDVMMPRMSGDRMVEAIRAHAELDDVPVVLLTAKADDDLRLRMLQHGVQDYLCKPFSEQEVRARVDGLVAARSRTREALRRMAERLESHVRHSPLAVVEFDPQCRIIRWAGQAEALFGWTAAEVLGKRIDELRWVHDDDAEHVRELAAAMVERPGSAGMHANRNYRKDGSVITCEWYNSTIADHTGALESVLSLVLDVTERRAAASELEHLYQRTREDADTRARLLMEVNHRVKNSLLALLGSFVAEERLRGAGAEHGGREFVERFSRRVRALLSAHEALSRTSWAPMNLTDLAADVLRTTLSGAGMDTRVAVQVMPSDVLVSPRQVASLAMILSELATNTTKHALRADGTVAVTVRAALDGSQLAVEFRDNGPGYAPEVLRGEHGGVGLKLIREMVSGTLRGSVALASEDGAVIRIRIETDEPDRT